MNVLMCVSVVILSSGEPVLRAVTYQSKMNLEYVTDYQLNNPCESSFWCDRNGNASKFAPEEVSSSVVSGVYRI